MYLWIEVDDLMKSEHITIQQQKDYRRHSLLSLKLNRDILAFSHHLRDFSPSRRCVSSPKYIRSRKTPLIHLTEIVPRIRLPLSYPFTAPIVKPDMKYRCSAMNSRMIGTDTMVAAAIISS